MRRVEPMLAGAIAMLAVLAIPAEALGDVVTERWGSGRCRHAETVSVEKQPSGGIALRFDLSALPRGTRVLRARLLPGGSSGGAPLAEPLVVRPLRVRGAEKALVPSGEPFELVGPRFVSLDATAVVRAWVSGGLPNHGLLVEGPSMDVERVALDVTYEGSLSGAPPAVTGLRAFHRAGQVFLTWDEIDSPFRGRDEVTWRELETDLKRTAEGERPAVSYRIYRHDSPITGSTIADAELLDEVPQHSALDQREIQTEWKGEQIKNVRLEDAPVPRTAVDERSELPAGTGVFVRTSRGARTSWFAVVATLDGVENTVTLDEGSTAGPIQEEVAPTEPILFRVQRLQYQKRDQECYVWWLDPPLWNLPHYVHLSVAPPELEDVGPRPLFVANWWWGSGWNRATQCPMESATVLTIDQNCMETRGFHDGCGTRKAWSQGTVQGYFVRQLRALLPWLERKHSVDADRIFAISSGWAWHYPDLFAAVFECTSMDPKRSPAAMECRRCFGDPRRPASTEWGVSAWEWWDAPGWIRDHPSVELPLITYAPCMHTGDFGTLDKPPLYRSLLDTKRAWSAIFDEGTNIGHRSPSWMFEIRRSDSLAAFGRCSLDDDPGIGLGWQPGGQMNAYLCFDPRSGVDLPDRWEMTLYLVAGDESGRGGAPLDRCTVDVTPRRCRRLVARPGDEFAWTNTALADGQVIQSGVAVADGLGLVTATQVIVSKGKNRLVLRRARAAAVPGDEGAVIALQQGSLPAASWTGCLDTWISDEEWERNADSGSSETLRAGGRRAVLLRFDLSTVPVGVPVHRAVLRVADAGFPQARSDAPDRRALRAFVLARDWKASANWREHTRTAWETRDVGDWLSPGGDIRASADLGLGEGGLAATGILFAGPWGHLHELDVTEVVRQWLSGALANHGLLLRSQERVEVASAEWPVPAGRPLLLIDAGKTPAGIPQLENPPAELALDAVSSTPDAGAPRGDHRRVTLTLGQEAGDACTYVKENEARFPGTWGWLDHCRIGGSAGDFDRTLIRFDLGRLPAGASVREARLVCTLEPRTSHLEGGQRYGAFLVRLPEAPGWSEEATARERKPGVPWPAGGARASAGDAPLALGRIATKQAEAQGERRAATVEISFDLSGAVRAWLSGRVPNCGLLLDNRIEGGAYDIYSSRAAAALRPRLEVLISPEVDVPPPSEVEPSPPAGDYWVEPMREVHRRFRGTPGTLAQYGDSITVTMAFLAGYSWAGKIDAKNVSPELRRRLDLVEAYSDLRLWREWKGGEWGCTGMMRSDWLLQNVDSWQQKMRPEAAVVLFGTNDLGGLLPPDYTENMAASLRVLLATGTVPMLTSIPPAARGGHREYWLAALSIARGLKVPLIDYHAEILRRRPEDWNGALEKFRGHSGDEYQVPTLISGDGTHPSNPTEWQNDFGEEALSRNGYNLRNYLTLVAYAQVIEKVLRP